MRKNKTYKDAKGGHAVRNTWASWNPVWKRRDRRQFVQIIRNDLYQMYIDQAEDLKEWYEEEQKLMKIEAFADDPYDNFPWTVFEDEIPKGMYREY